MGLRNKRTGTAEKDGTAQASGAASSQGKRQRAKKDVEEPAAVVAPIWPDAGSDTDPLVGHFATIYGGAEFEDDDGPHSIDGLHGVVQGIQFGDDGHPVSATFGIRTQARPGVYRPPTGDGNIVVPWKNLRRSVSAP